MKVNKDNIIYYIAFIILEFVTLSSISKLINIYEVISKFLYVVILIMFFIKIVFSKYTLKELVFVGITSVICLYITLVTSNNLFIVDCLALFALKKVNLNKLVKIDLVIKLIFIISHVLLFSIDLFASMENALNTLRYTISGETRFAFYFSHPNSFNGILACAFIDIVILSKRKKISGIITMSIMLLFAKLTYSRTSTYIYFVFILLMILLENEKIKNIAEKLPIPVFMFSAIGSYIIANLSEVVFWKNSIIVKINKILSGRLHLGMRAVKRYGVNLLPATIRDNYLENSLTIDNFYIRSFIEYGIIVLILIFVLYLITQKYKKNKVECIIFILLPIYLIFELYPINVGRTIFLLIIGNVLVNNEKNNFKERKNENEKI